MPLDGLSLSVLLQCGYADWGQWDSTRSFRRFHFDAHKFALFLVRQFYPLQTMGDVNFGTIQIQFSPEQAERFAASKPEAEAGCEQRFEAMTNSGVYESARLLDVKELHLLLLDSRRLRQRSDVAIHQIVALRVAERNT